MFFEEQVEDFFAIDRGFTGFIAVPYSSRRFECPGDFFPGIATSVSTEYHNDGIIKVITSNMLIVFSHGRDDFFYWDIINKHPIIRGNVLIWNVGNTKILIRIGH